MENTTAHAMGARKGRDQVAQATRAPAPGPASPKKENLFSLTPCIFRTDRLMKVYYGPEPSITYPIIALYSNHSHCFPVGRFLRLALSSSRPPVLTYKKSMLRRAAARFLAIHQESPRPVAFIQNSTTRTLRRPEIRHCPHVHRPSSIVCMRRPALLAHCRPGNYT